LTKERCKETRAAAKRATAAIGSIASDLSAVIEAESHVPTNKVPIADPISYGKDEDYETGNEILEIATNPKVRVPIVDENPTPKANKSQLKTTDSSTKLSRSAPTMNFQVFAPVSNFTDIRAYSHIPDDLIDLFDDSNYTDEDKVRSIGKLIKKN